MRRRSHWIRAALGAATVITLGAACANGSKSATASRAAPESHDASVAANAPAALKAPSANVKLEHATFAGGCFWCEETAFEGLPGVQSVTSGYTGGFQKDPTYEEVSAGTTGHAESVDIVFDPAKVTYAQLVDLFWHNVDPTQANGQFCDHGTQYRSAIFYHGSAQQTVALASKKAIENSKRFDRPIVTELVAATQFYPAEEYHQDFYKKDPIRYKTYRFGCGRDQRLKEIWGQPGRQGGH